MPRLSAVWFATFVSLLQHAPLAAQAGGASELARTSVTSVHAYVASESIPRQLAAPSNITTSPEVRRILEAMLRESPTFRRQCLRIASEPNLTVEIQFGPPFQRSDIRAKTRLTRQPGGTLEAAIRIRVPGDSIELIAHELEHVIEQLDGIDLAARAAQHDSGVTALSRAPDVFETVRAKRAGQKVSLEITR